MADEQNDGAGAGEPGGAAGGSGGAADLWSGGGQSGGDASAGSGSGGAGDQGAAGQGAGDGGGQGAGDAGQQGAADPEWYSSLSADAEGDQPSLRDWAKASGVKDVAALAKIARDNQVALRGSGRVKVPGENASDEERAEFNKAIGVPDDPKGYEIAAPTGEDGKPMEGVELNSPLIERLAASAHKAGVPKAGFEQLAGEFIQAQLDDAAATDKDQQKLADSTVKEWGDQKAAKLAAIDSAARALQLSSKDLVAIRNSLGADRALNMFARLGEGMQEDVMVTGGKGRFGISGADAQAEMDRLKNDEAFQQKVMVPGSPERQRWERLQSAAGAAEEAKQRAEA